MNKLKMEANGISIELFKLIGYPKEEIAKKNPQMKFDLGI
jgi:hypothetical protein